MDKAQRSAQNRRAAHIMWSRNDPAEHLKAANAARDKKFYDQADPDGTLSPEERERRAGHLRRAYYMGLSAKAAEARRRKKAS